MAINFCIVLAFTSGNGPHCDADYGRILYPAKYGFADKSLSVVNIISIEKYSGIAQSF